MTREEFIQELEEEGYSYKIKGDKIVVTHKGYVNLESLKILPPGVVFNNEGNEGSVNLESLKILPPGVVFNNDGYVRLKSITSLPPGVEFNNKGPVYLDSLTSLPPGVVFKNWGSVYLESIVGDWFKDWKGNIEGVDSKRLLNFMISKGVFER